MSVCTFFGHRECPSDIRPKLRELLIELIEDHAVDRFYVGNNGAFDRLVRSVLRELSEDYPHIRYAVVMERFPEKCGGDWSDTILPEGIEEAPRRFAIDRRNRWMLRQSEIVVSYVTHSWGGAAKYAEMAARQEKSVFNLAGR